MKPAFNTLISTHHPILIGFYAKGCSPCKKIVSVLKQVKDQVGRRVKIIKINVQENPGLAERFNIYGIPHLAIFIDGQIYWRHLGILQAPEIIAQLEAALRSSVHEHPPTLEEID